MALTNAQIVEISVLFNEKGVNNKAELARRFDVSPRTIGRALEKAVEIMETKAAEKVDTAEKVKAEIMSERLAKIESEIEEKQKLTIKRPSKKIAYVNPNFKAKPTKADPVVQTTASHTAQPKKVVNEYRDGSIFQAYQKALFTQKHGNK